MIAAVPEIVDDANHGVMADLLVDWLQREPSASPVLLDTLGNLSVPAEQSRQIVDSILELLPSQKAEQLPVTLRYLFQAANASNVSKVRANHIFSLPYHMSFVLSFSTSVFIIFFRCSFACRFNSPVTITAATTATNSPPVTDFQVHYRFVAHRQARHQGR